MHQALAFPAMLAAPSLKRKGSTMDSLLCVFSNVRSMALRAHGASSASFGGLLAGQGAPSISSDQMLSQTHLRPCWKQPTGRPTENFARPAVRPKCAACPVVSIWSEEIEGAWAGQKTAKEALDAAVRGGKRHAADFRKDRKVAIHGAPFPLQLRSREHRMEGQRLMHKALNE